MKVINALISIGCDSYTLANAYSAIWMSTQPRSTPTINRSISSIFTAYLLI